ncbi:MAG: hypothetical protein JNN30_14820 [Rhodanobacteraceae bacterium]|nr:hypothetical protein [Rhodanobacteraceae bacterium]
MERVVRCRTINASGKSKAEIAFEERGGRIVVTRWTAEEARNFRVRISKYLSDCGASADLAELQRKRSGNANPSSFDDRILITEESAEYLRIRSAGTLVAIGLKGDGVKEYLFTIEREDAFLLADDLKSLGF